MSQAGTVLTVHNIGETACSISGLPDLVLRNAAGRTVATSVAAGAFGMNAGPVGVPVTLEPGMIAGMTLRWISGPVFAKSVKIVATTVALPTSAGTVTALLGVTMYAPGKTPTFDESQLTTELPELGAATPFSSVVSGSWYGSGPVGSTLLSADGKPADVLKLRLGAKPSFAFDLDNGAASAHIGSISGPLVVSGTHAIFSDPKQDCTLDFSSYGNQLVVTQKGTCGFGEGVSAARRYTAVS